MKRSIDETAERFDGMSRDYDETRSDAHVKTAERVVERTLERVDGDERVVDIGTGTGAVALALAPHVALVHGLDVSEGMLERAREKARERGTENVEFGRGTFREPGIEDADVVVSSFAMHHLDDEEKRDAVAEMRRLARRVVLGDLMIFPDADVNADDLEYYDPEVDDPSEVDDLVGMFEDEGFEVEHERVATMTGVVEARLHEP